MDETFLMTIKSVAQAGVDLIILPDLSRDKYHFDAVERIKIIKPDSQVIEMEVEFSIPFIKPLTLTPHPPVYMILIPNTQKDEIPVDSQVWIKKTLEQITRLQE